MTNVRILPKIDLAPVDETVFVDGRVRLLPVEEWRALGDDVVSSWCVQRARYGIVTLELVRFLGEIIGDRMKETLEIGAGMGDLGFHLGCRMTDSAIQATSALIAAHYRALGQMPIVPPADVERIDANAAVEKYKPSIVIGSWITQRFVEGDDAPPPVKSSIYGVDEIAILRDVDIYVHIGNDDSHEGKRAFRRPHTKTYARWLVSRAYDQSKNAIWVWRK